MRAELQLARIRALMLVAASEGAGLTPIPVAELHAFAFLANVLSPVWDIPPQERTVLKKRGGPFFPDLQSEIDTLVGRRLVSIERLSYKEDLDGQWRLEGNFFVENFERVETILDRICVIESEERYYKFLSSLAFAYASVSAKDRMSIAQEDAIYSDDIGYGRVIDYADRKNANFSANSAAYFGKLLPAGIDATPARKLHLYAAHLSRRLAAHV